MYILILIIILFVVIRLLLSRKFINDKFLDNNVIVFGAKGTGKDLLFQGVIRQQKKREYYSNIDYGYKYNHITVKDLTVSPNTYINFINGNIDVIPKNENMEGKHVFISDGGVILPAHMDNQLSKIFPSFPIYYALSRHLYNQNIHINSQALNRIWLKLREQSDHYFKTLRSFKLFGLMFTKVRYFSEYQSAETNKLPFKKGFISSKQTRALYNEFEATNGIIKNMWYVQTVKGLKYDTRIFHKIIFGIKFTSLKRLKKSKAQEKEKEDYS